MSSSIPAIRFLLDENVRRDLERFLKERGFDVRRLPTGTSDKAIAAASWKEQRIIVTNDDDFASLLSEEVFSVV